MSPGKSRREPANPDRTPTLIVKSYRDFTAQDAGSPVDAGRLSGEESGKFVLLSKGRSLHLILSPVSLTPYHANIVYQYLHVEGRGEVEGVSSGGCRIITKGWEVHGGGHYTVQHWLHNILFHGKSTAFGKYAVGKLGALSPDVAAKLGLEGYTLEFQ